MTLKDPLLGRECKNYRLVERLGGGAFGVVYRAEHTRIQKDFAIKVLHPHIATDKGVVERFHREARSLATLNHPNIVQIVDFDLDDTLGLYLVMEWLRGQPLNVILKQEQRLPVRLVGDIFSQMLSALQEAHEQGIVHRDLKPANLMLLDSGERPVLKLLDFGIAFLGDEDHGLTTEGTAMGSANYMSPEQALGQIRSIDERSDLYSCGIILGKSLTGCNIFTAESPTQILWKHVYEEAPKLRDLYPQGHFPESLERVFARAVAKKKEDRFPNAMEFRVALKDALRDFSSRSDLPAPQSSALDRRQVVASSPSLSIPKAERSPSGRYAAPNKRPSGAKAMPRPTSMTDAEASGSLSASRSRSGVRALVGAGRAAVPVASTSSPELNAQVSVSSSRDIVQDKVPYSARVASGSFDESDAVQVGNVSASQASISPADASSSGSRGLGSPRRGGRRERVVSRLIATEETKEQSPAVRWFHDNSTVVLIGTLCAVIFIVLATWLLQPRQTNTQQPVPERRSKDVWRELFQAEPKKPKKRTQLTPSKSPAVSLPS